MTFISFIVFNQRPIGATRARHICHLTWIKSSLTGFVDRYTWWGYSGTLKVTRPSSHWTSSDDRNPRETRVSSKTTRVLSACCCFSLLLQINVWTIRKVCHVERQSFNSYCLWPFPQSPASTSSEIRQRPTQQLESSATLTLPKGLRAGKHNYILQPNCEIKITVKTAHSEADRHEPHYVLSLSV